MKYDYKCPAGHVREVEHKMSETPEIHCEAQCGDCPNEDQHGCDLPMQRVIGSAAWIPCQGMAAFDARIREHNARKTPDRV
jgi:predicted nucleic acid-binding Zn ribbon protein